MQNESKLNDAHKSNDSPYTSPQAESAERGASTFSLATLMSFTSLCAVGFGITYYTFGLGLAFFIVGILAFVRVKLHHRTGWVHGFEGTALAVTLAIVLTPICCGVAFFTNCFAAAMGADELGLFQGLNDLTYLMLMAFGLGGLTALQVAEMIFAFCLRKKTYETS